MRRVLALLLLALSALVPATGVAAEPVPEVTQEDHDRAIALALDDPHTTDRLSLRNADADVKAGLIDFSTSDDPLKQQLGYKWVVGWYADGEEQPFLTATVDLDAGTVKPAGQSLIVMPDRSTATFRWLHRFVAWGPMSLAFLVCVLLAPGRRFAWKALSPLVVVAIAFVVTVDNSIPRDAVRWGNAVLFGVAVAALATGAITWLRLARRPVVDRAATARVAWPFWLAMSGVGIGLQLLATWRTYVPLDVGFASHLGALLVRDGFPVYGNTTDLSGVVSHGDTYGPIAYLAHVPATFVSENVRDVSVGTNLVVGAIVAVLLFVLGRRHVDVRTGLWAAATWLTCPFVAMGIVAGNNDVLVAAALAIVPLVIARPAWRGAALALAACTKFLPAVAILALLRLRGEPRSALLRTAGAFAGSIAVLFFIALRGFDALDEFWARAVVFQMDRDDIASFWGLTELGSLRHVFTVAAVVVSAWSIRFVRRHGEPATFAAIAAVLALLLAGLPQYWGAYVTWIVPLVLALVVWRPAANEP